MAKNEVAKEVVREKETLLEEGKKLVAELTKINNRLNRIGASKDQFTVKPGKEYKPAPPDVEEASEKVLTANKSGLNVAGWLRAVNLETKGIYGEAQLKEFLEILIGDGVIKEEQATGGKSKEKKLTLA